MTSSMPTSRATRGRRGGVSPVSSTGRRPSAVQPAIAARARRLGGVGDDEQAAHRAVPAGRDDRLAARLRGRARPSSSGGSCGPARRAGSDGRRRPRGRRRRPRRRGPRGCGTTSTAGSSPTSRRRGVGDRRGAIGCSEASLERAGQAQQLARGRRRRPATTSRSSCARSSRCRSCRARSCRCAGSTRAPRVP